MTEALELVAGGVYRNCMDAEVRVLHQLNRNFKRHDPLFEGGVVPAILGDIWVAEDPDFYGPGRMLVTAEGLAVCGYVRIEDA